jgi:NTP pyrophosphatase (non-canonical NTP hydrolase)
MTTVESGATLAELTAAVLAFRDERDWARFHTPKDVALSLVLEAAEVLELFQWRDEAAARALLAEPAGRAALAAELADVLSWILLLAHEGGDRPGRRLPRQAGGQRPEVPGRPGARPGRQIHALRPDSSRSGGCVMPACSR